MAAGFPDRWQPAPNGTHSDSTDGMHTLKGVSDACHALLCAVEDFVEGLPEGPVRAGYCHEGSNITDINPVIVAQFAQWRQRQDAASVLADPQGQTEANKRSVEARTIAEYFSDWKGRTERPHVECREYSLCCARCEFRPVGSVERLCHRCVGRT